MGEKGVAKEENFVILSYKNSMILRWKEDDALGMKPSKFQFHRPNRVLLEATLQKEGYRMAAVAVHLAWQLGLLRQEIHDLTWEQVDFASSVVRLPDREIPMSPELQVYLQGLQMERRKASGPVVLSDRDRRQPTEQHVSFVVRQLMNEIGQEQVRLLDLRYDYTECLLQTHSWEYVSRVAGMDVRSLQLHFSKPDDGWTEPEEAETAIDAQRLQKIIENEGYSAVAVTLRLAWQLGVPKTVMHALRWDMVDWQAGTLDVAGEKRRMPEELCVFLKELEARNHQWSDHILISDRAHKEIERSHLSRMVRAALVRGGCPQVTIPMLRRDWEMQARWAEPIQTYLEHHGRMVRRKVMELLNLSGNHANRVMQWLTERGVVVTSGRSYYLTGTVVPPEQQKDVILAYLANHPGCRCGELGNLLGLEQKHCLTVLQKLMAQGLIERENNRYYVTDP